jgi:cell division topological specificity factor
MGFLDYFRSSPRSTASIAKERLQIIVAHERRRSPTPDFLPMLQKDLLDVVRKYIHIDEDQIKLSVERNGDCEVLELNIALSEGQTNR